uniref:Uncharacterized protein n=1 Tax=Meloidogyne enterolobii TaxID=390850 RepID=A0A6V7WHK3_MELEN|nr:unnamed protein product [Meloidogyne enterolobii]
MSSINQFGTVLKLIANPDHILLPDTNPTPKQLEDPVPRHTRPERSASNPSLNYKNYYSLS